MSEQDPGVHNSTSAEVSGIPRVGVGVTLIHLHVNPKVDGDLGSES
jgi:hypothetical protein